MGWPQIVMIVLMSISVVTGLILHGQERPKYNAIVTIIDTAITAWLLYSGGFFK